MPLPPAKLRNRIKLSRQEMCGISQAISRDFSPRFIARKATGNSKIQFSSQELREISRQISREHAPSRDNHLPRLVLLAVSPKKLHAYWHITKQRLTQALKRTEQPPPMTLRIYMQPESPLPASAQSDDNVSWFDVAISSEDGHQDIYPPEPAPASPRFQYRAVLGEIQGDRIFVPLTRSNTTEIPYLPAPPARYELANTMTAFIMPAFSPAPSAGKTASGQGKSPPR